MQTLRMAALDKMMDGRDHASRRSCGEHRCRTDF